MHRLDDCAWLGVLLTLFVCFFGVFRPTWEFSLIRRSHHYQRRAANFDLCSALMTIEQWGFFSVLHLLWHWTSVFNGHFRGPETFKPIAEHLAVACSNDLGLSRLRFEHPTFRLQGQYSNPLRHHRGTWLVYQILKNIIFLLYRLWTNTTGYFQKYNVINTVSFHTMLHIHSTRTYQNLIFYHIIIRNYSTIFTEKYNLVCRRCTNWAN